MQEIKVILGDITSLEVDAIVNAANTDLRPGAGVDGAIHKKAGPELARVCQYIGKCKTGHAVFTNGFRLPARYVIHTASPTVEEEESDALLAQCYTNALNLALSRGVRTIAFPLISAGFGGGFSSSQATRVALSAINQFVKSQHEYSFKEITIVLFKNSTYQVFKQTSLEMTEENTNISLTF